jgi:hypothetical protein
MFCEGVFQSSLHLWIGGDTPLNETAFGGAHSSTWKYAHPKHFRCIREKAHACLPDA